MHDESIRCSGVGERTRTSTGLCSTRYTPEPSAGRLLIPAHGEAILASSNVQIGKGRSHRSQTGVTLVFV